MVTSDLTSVFILQKQEMLFNLSASDIKHG